MNNIQILPLPKIYYSNKSGFDPMHYAPDLRLPWKVIRAQLGRTLFQRYHNSIADSNANGSNNIIVLIVFFFFSSLVIAGSFLSSLGVSIVDFSWGEFPLLYFPIMTAYTVFGSTCFLWNVEFKNFLRRKITSSSSRTLNSTFSLFTRSFYYTAKNSVHPKH